MLVRTGRIYGAQTLLGYRVLVDRLWPRGVSKVEARLDAWCKDIAPSTALRKWFGHQPERYAEFHTKYIAELDTNPATPEFLAMIQQHLDVVLLYGAKDTVHNEAVVLQDYIAKKLA